MKITVSDDDSSGQIKESKFKIELHVFSCGDCFNSEVCNIHSKDSIQKAIS